MATVVREIERKYEPGTAGAAAALDAVKPMTGTAGVAAVSQQGEYLLDAVYYDTADLRLIGAGITLRRRIGGEDAGWHLKLPAGPDTRDEIRLPLAEHPGKPRLGAASGTARMRAATPPASGCRAVPKELAALVRASTRDAPLAPIVHIQTRRRGLRLLDSVGRTLAEIVVDHVSAGPADGSAPTAWDEIEAELVTGDPKLLNVIDMRLRKAGARSAPTATKLQRALDGRLPAAAAQLPPLTAQSTAGEVVLAYLRDQIAAISRYDPLARRGEPDAVHQMRIATRRARSTLQAFGRVVEREATRPLCAELKWLAAVLGQARDAEVLQDRLASDLAAIPPPWLWVRWKPVRHTQRRLQHALAAVPGAEGRDAAIHEARKAAKRARYAAEAAVPALGGKAERQAMKAKELQQLLGDHHDSVVARAVLLDLATTARAGGQDTFSYGQMYQSQVCQAAAIEQPLPRIATAAIATAARSRGFVSHQS